MGFGERLKQLRERLNLTQQDIADMTGSQRSTVANWETKERHPNIDVQKKLADYFGVSLDYLLDNSNVEEKRTQTSPDANVDFTPIESETVLINVLGSVPAGIPHEAVQDIVGQIHVPRSWTENGEECTALIVNGDSMEPEYLPGDILILRVQNDCDSGDDAVVFVNGYDATFKRIKKVGNRIILQPLNSKYEPMSYGPGDEEIKILGVVKEMRRNK